MIPAGVRIFVGTEPVDMRLGFDRLAQLARERMGCDPVEGGALFVFAGRAATRLKVLWFDRNGLCLLSSACTRPCSSCRRRSATRRRCTSTRPRSRGCSPA